MAWLIGIICIVIIFKLWEIFLPLAIIAVIGIGLLYAYFDYSNEKKINEKETKAQQFKDKISIAQKNATPEGRQWYVSYAADPASGIKIARSAVIKSNDSLCRLAVEKRINGSELTDLRCYGIKISSFDDVYIKFDTSETSKKMTLKNYTNSDDVYISSYQGYSSQLSYEEFINGLITGNSLAVKFKIPYPYNYWLWVRFNLKGSKLAISQLGKPKEN